MRYRRLALMLVMGFLGACSNQNGFVNDLNTSFSNWNDDPYNSDVKVYALADQATTSQSQLSWKKEQSQKVIEVVQFDFDNATVSADYWKMIRQQAQYIHAHPGIMLRVAGHADERGSREYNISLGWKRASAVAAYFEQYGVPKQKILIVSYGKEKPIVSGHNPEAWAKNRRVEVFYEETS